MNGPVHEKDFFDEAKCALVDDLALIRKRLRSAHLNGPEGFNFESLATITEIALAYVHMMARNR